ncbi:sulfatase-like hydrolase/transferase [Polaribacter sp. Z014]|uniref:sulfatase-like hydrolase/transferase n=1 Tax=Polaribacter sp. Z014 TaxID=2927126 RepID=UPI002020893F|nr:sulfatase-like hydrolase/transferase [Polaribacter sp. Z014]MCL7762959.1 sulfatase-like hydrolase/transferase [Polaribacter sp. Z014]
MKNNYFKRGVLLFVLLISLSNYAQTQGIKPNIIVILADDLGYGDVGFNRDASFPEDRGVIPTPNIDALANNGIVLKNAHVAHPFCGPSRVAILTGMMPHRIGAQYNLPNDITSTLGVPTNETYFSTVLKKASYNTAAFGKWHLGFQDGKYQPLDRGFDFFFGFLGGGKNYFESVYEDGFYNRLGGSNPVTNEYQDPIWRDRGYVARDEFSNAENEDYLTDLLTDEAIAYEKRVSASSDPYFMYLAYNAPHTPLQAPEAEIAQFKLDNPNFEDLIRNSPYITESTPVNKLTDAGEKAALIEKFVQARITYATMVTNMDTNIGRLITELKKDMNKFNNTVIIFLSDNGGYTLSKGAVNWPLDQGKGSVKEGGHKVPMFVSWPAKITGGGPTYDHQISSLDLYPTLVGLAGETIPEGKTIDGVDFMDKIIAGQDARPDDGILLMRPQNGFHNGGIAYDKWKIVKTANGGKWNLFDISTDPGETTNVRSSEPNGEQIVQTILDNAIAKVVDFKDVKPAWYDNDGDGSGHIHSFLWADGTLPGYDRLFETPLLKLEGELSEITIAKTTDAIEGGVNGVFTISLPEGVNATENIDITYTVSGVATEGTDYTALSGTATIANGTNATQIIIDATQDTENEVSESVVITLASTSFGSVLTTPAEITIFDVIESTVLTAGDIAIVGWKSGKGKLAFMLLKDISATTKLSISNRTWSNTANGFTGDYSVDDIFTWSPGAAFSIGDIFILDDDGLVKHVTNNTEEVAGTTSHDYTGKVAETSDGDFDFSVNGEGILIFQADPFALPADANSTAWITGINTALGWGNGGGNSACQLPTALTNGVNANNVGEKHDFGVYTGALSGTAAQLRASINDVSNWSFSEDTEYNLWRFDKTSNSISGNIGTAGTLSTSDQIFKKLSVFPNPSGDYFYVNYSGVLNKLEVEVYTASGKSVKKVTETNVNNPRIDISNLASGIYILKIKTDENFLIKKIIKL